MENEVLQTVLTEVLEELKEVRRQQVQIARVLLEVQEKVAGCEVKLTSCKINTPAAYVGPITTAINNALQKIESSIEARPKNITKQFRVLLFPEYNAGEYYKLVFGRVLFWMLMFLTVTYLYLLGKDFIEKY